MNGIIPINKPQGFTSHDVVAKTRGILKTKKIGHGGTLDPLATGVLPLFVGSCTRAVDLIACEQKSYTATVRMGIQTDSGDITGEVIRRSDLPTREKVQKTMEAFVGLIEQCPPMYSAVRVGGKRLYEIARKGGEIERPIRRVTVFSARLTEWNDTAFTMEVVCSKGTYIRTLAEDICLAAGSLGTIEKLVRTETLGFKLEECITLEELAELSSQGKAMTASVPLSRVFSNLPVISIDKREMSLYMNGVRITRTEPDGRYAVYHEGRLFSVADMEKGRLCRKAVFTED